MTYANDLSGDVYVTGQMVQNGATVIAVWKYNASGAQAWMRTWPPAPDPNLSVPKPAAVAIRRLQGGGEELFVVGTVGTQMQGTDIVAIHYNVDGIGGGEWTRFNGSGNGDDYAVGVAVDDRDTAWVGGVSQSLTGGLDYLVWGVRTDGTTVAFDEWDHSGKSDLLVDIKVYTAVQLETGEDYTGIIVTGSSWNGAGASGLDIQTLEYRYDNHTGQLTLPHVFRYESPGTDKATSLDFVRPTPPEPHASIFVSGYNDNTTTASSQIVVLGYPASGGAWNPPPTYVYPASHDAWATSTKLVVGAPHDVSPSEYLVYVAGQTFTGTGNHVVVLAYNAAGVQQWFQTPYLSSDNGVVGHESAVDIDIAQSGYLYVLGSHWYNSKYHYRTIKLDPDMEIINPAERLMWAIEHGPTGYEIPGALRINPLVSDARFADVYVTGLSIGGTLASPSYSTIRYLQTE